MTGAKLWGGVFDKQPDDLAWSFGQSLSSDWTLLDEEFEVSIAHAEMLTACGIVSPEDGRALVEGLVAVHEGLVRGTLQPPEDAEDLHGAVESLLVGQIGETAKRLHAARSRNDQIVTMTRMWLKRRCKGLSAAIAEAQASLLGLAEKHLHDVMPGYTHQQPAQPVTLGYLFLAYFWMLERDKVRFAQVAVSADESPLGACALAGTSLPIDRTMTAERLGFAAPSPNALDAVSDRDFVGDALHACATLMQHLSRIGQEVVLFSTAEYGFMSLDQAYSTGSSVMPQKRNPDLAELVRGRTGRVIGHWTAFMCTMKALPLGYNRDQQEDKPPLFDAVRLCTDSLKLVQEMLKTAEYYTDRLAQAAESGFSSATFVAERLVSQGVPFREAHETVGALVKECLFAGTGLSQASAPDDPCLEAALRDASPSAAVSARGSLGGTSPDALSAQLLLAQSHISSSPGLGANDLSTNTNP